MNIWIFNHYAHPPNRPGGTRHYDLGKELLRNGHQIVIFASGFSHSQHYETNLNPYKRWKIEDVDGVKFVWLKTFPYRSNDWRRVLNMTSYMFCAWKLGRQLPKFFPTIGRPDVIIGSSVHLLAVLAAYWVAKYHHCKFIMEVRDLWPQTIIDMGELKEKSPVTKLLQMLERYLYIHAERIITLMPLAHEYIVRCGVPREKIVFIPNGVDLSRFSCSATSATSHNGFLVMYLGAQGRVNALDVIMETAKIVQDEGYYSVNFKLIGDGLEKPRLREMAKKLELKNVEFRDPVPKELVPEILQEADSTLIVLQDIDIYRYGISPNKVYDFLASEKPMILAGNPAENFVKKGQCGITVPPRNPKALAEAIIKLYQMPKEERDALGRRGREYVEQHHSIVMLAERLEQAIN